MEETPDNILRPIPIKSWGSRWQHELKLKDIWAKHSDPECEEWVDTLGKEVARRIRKAGFYGTYEDQEELEAIIEEFEGLDEWSSPQDFNAIFSSLYDWCDRGKRVWIETFF